MERDPEKVRHELYSRVLRGGFPRYDFESCCDNYCDFLILTKAEFDRIVEKAKSDRRKNRDISAKLAQKRLWIKHLLLTFFLVVVMIIMAVTCILKNHDIAGGLIIVTTPPLILAYLYGKRN